MDSTPAVDPASNDSGKNTAIRILCQDSPDMPTRWEEFSVPRKPAMTVVSCLQQIAAFPLTTSGKATTPPAYESGCLEEICGACTMIINGRARPACTAMVDEVAADDQPIVLEPMTKFPLIRDLIVDRHRFFTDLKRVQAWATIDGTIDIGPAPAISPKIHDATYPLSSCIGCACCLEACPQFTAVNRFVGAAAINQARLFNEIPAGAPLKEERLESLTEEGGVSECAKSGNCVKVCPAQIPLMESIATIGRQATVHTIRKFFTK